MNVAEHMATVPRGELKQNEPMSRHTTWRVGGPARGFFQPADLPDLQAFLQQLDAAEKLFWVGLGSNLLVRDGGIDAVVIAPLSGLRQMTSLGGGRFRFEAGVPCNKVARFSAQQGYVGAEFLAGIPGTLGGALAMNAGAWGGETWDFVEQVETIDRRGQVHRRSAAEFKVGYRHIAGPEEEWFVAAVMQFADGDVEAAQRRIQQLLAQRSATQPSNQPSCGSVFRNPEGDHAARLIEAAGLKGYCIGKACVSEKHANFIINSGGATAADIEALITHVQRRVAEKSGIDLQHEVRIVGKGVE